MWILTARPILATISPRSKVEGNQLFGAMVLVSVLGVVLGF